MRFIGNVRQLRPLPHSILSGGEAVLEVSVSVAENQDIVRFVIDTGAEVTVLGPDAALSVLGPAALNIDFARDSRSLHLLGIGGGAHHIVRDAELILRSSEGERYSVEMPVLLAEPHLPGRFDSQAPQPPSLLGRDFLRRFRLELLCGEQRSVVLETL